jgi:predicted nucleotidyltransferase
MGTSRGAIGAGVAEALFPEVRRGVLGLLLSHPDERFYLRQISELAGVGLGHLQRELARLVAAGVIRRSQEGRQVYFSADPTCPIFDELRGIVRKTVGGADMIATALSELWPKLQVVFIFGSVARGDEKATSDLDLMVIGDASFAEVVGAVAPAENALRRPINPLVYPSHEWRRKVGGDHHFLAAIMRREKLFIKGNDDELEALSR